MQLSGFDFYRRKPFCGHGNWSSFWRHPNSNFGLLWELHWICLRAELRHLQSWLLPPAAILFILVNRGSQSSRFTLYRSWLFDCWNGIGCRLIHRKLPCVSRYSRPRWRLRQSISRHHPWNQSIVHNHDQSLRRDQHPDDHWPSWHHVQVGRPRPNWRIDFRVLITALSLWIHRNSYLDRFAKFCHIRSSRSNFHDHRVVRLEPNWRLPCLSWSQN